jgi:hypothetical protein
VPTECPKRTRGGPGECPGSARVGRPEECLGTGTTILDLLLGGRGKPGSRLTDKRCTLATLGAV